ncbi:MAG: hypothetical protein ONB44_16480 [candidate division KSB1 bacterium]|nr:hypothetical protein [candidate division KSB1 bacterium]MDZ7303731.1 hypothetical protein [candidate division KSB1 bacterium]MDZ7313132.1 hypothetical protein [candidate division KSB1 bacterium]
MTVKNFMQKFDALSPKEQKRTLALFGPPCCTEFMGNHERMQRLLRRCSKRLAPQQLRDMLNTIMNVNAKAGTI